MTLGIHSMGIIVFVIIPPTEKGCDGIVAVTDCLFCAFMDGWLGVVRYGWLGVCVGMLSIARWFGA